MCLVRSRPAWEEDVVFANRPARRRHSHNHSRTRVSETTITERRESDRAVQYVQPPPPRVSTPIIRPATPPRMIEAPVRIELINVEEDKRTSPRTSRVSVSTGRGKSRRASHGAEEVYIERERERVRIPEKPREEYETYRYVPGADRYDGDDLRRSRSITYETNPRHSQRVVERERVVVEDNGRRREYYRRP